MPPTKILIATAIDEFEVLSVTYRRPIEREIFEPNFVLRLLVVPGEIDRGALPHGRATAPLAVTKFKQSAFNLNHAAHVFNRSRRGFHRRVKLIADQMLDVVNQQFL